MKNLIYTLLIILLVTGCEQEVIDLLPPEVVEEPAACPPDASAGNANFTKFVAIGSSYTAGFQAGALFNAGQDHSLAHILAIQFACVGGGAFNQPNIHSEVGYNIFVTPNPMGNVVLGRFKLQGDPPTPQPVVSGTVGNEDALPNPQVNPGFMYTGSAGGVSSIDQLNNFAVQAIVLGQALIPQTGDWSLAGMDPRFSPFYARFASNPGTSTLLGDAVSSLSNGGTFFLFWLGMDDVMLHAAFGGDGSKAPLSSFDFVSVSDPGWKNLYNNAINGILANPTLKGVVANYPDLFTIPYFTLVEWDAIPLDDATAGALTTNLANNYNAFLDRMVGVAAGFTAEEAALRKISYTAGQNPILLDDETLTDLKPYMQEPFAGLQPYARARQTKSTDIIPLATGGVLGVEVAPGQVLGVSVPVEDQYVIIPSESEAIMTRLTQFNAHVKDVADANPERLAFADINTAMKNLVTAQAGMANNIVYTPNIDPPTGIYSEDGLHPNSRGYAVIANIFIEAINAKFGASVPKANIGLYGATGLPIP